LNLTGQLLQSSSGVAAAGANEILINASGLNTGIYLVTLQNQGKIVSHKVLVN
jgi:hypothetical protein